MKQSIKLVLIYLAYQLLSGALIAGLAQICPISSISQLGYSLLLSSIAMTMHLIICKHIKLHQALRPVSLKILLYSIGCTLGAMLFCISLNEIIDLPNWLENDFIALSQTLLGATAIALAAPWVEELLFRGAIMENFNKQGNSPTKGIIMSALFFGIIHMNPAQVMFAFFMGLVLGWIAWRTRSLLPVIVGHALNNSLGVLEMITLDTDIQLISNTHTVPTLITISISGIAIVGLSMYLLNKATIHK